MMEGCSKEVFDLIGIHCEEIPWKYSALSELMLRNPAWWIGSTLTLGVTTPAATLPNEQTIEINWCLPLNEAGHKHMFSRLFCDYTTETSMVDVGSKRKYRKSEADVAALRRIVGLWQQVSAFCNSQMHHDLFTKFEADVLTTTRRDAEILSIIDQQPSRFAISQLKTFRELAVKGKQTEDRLIADTMAQQYLELREKQFEYFQANLEADWILLDKVRGAMSIIDDFAHVKKVVWLRDMATKADAAIKNHMDRFLRVDDAPNVDDAMKNAMSMMRLMQLEDSTSEVMVLGVMDFNVPRSTDAGPLEEFIIFCSRLNALGKHVATIMAFPDKVRAPPPVRRTVRHTSD